MPSTITYNASTGSDTAASGGGPATAITGTTATNGAGNVVNLDGTPDLSGVAVNDVIWVNSATTNRHLSRITAVDDGADTVTTEDLLVLGAGVSWAIGGERQTLENDTGNRDWLDYKSGWTIQLDGVFNTTAEFDPGEAGDDTAGSLTIQIKPLAASAEIAHDTSNQRTINITTASCRMTFDRVQASNTTTWVGGSMVRNASANGIINLKRCNINGKAASGGGPAIIDAAATVTNILGCYVHGQITNGFESFSGQRDVGLILGNWFDGGSGDGLKIINPSTYVSRTVERNLISNFTGDGMEIDNNANTSVCNILHNTVYNCANGINVLDPLTNSALIIRNNILVNNSGWAITSSTTGVTAEHVFCDYNAFYNNTSGEIQNAVDEGNNVTLTADPFTNAASDDFTLNNTAGGGADCRGAAFPTSILGSSMTNNLDIGALQHADPVGGGGGMIIHPGMTGGMNG